MMITLGDYHLPTKVSDEYIRNEPMWIVSLNTGENVYREQIDNMEDSWKRLKAYLTNNPSQHITSLRFRFRDHWEEIARDKDIFFFSNVVGCHYGGSPIYSFMGGFLNENNEISLKTFSIPELIKTAEEVRTLDNPTIQDGLIKRVY